MKSKYALFMLLLSVCASANAEWFLRGTQNNWAATPMESVGSGTNAVQAKGVVFAAPGNIKFDRYGDWSENYGVGGRNGTNVAVTAGTWDIKFFTDTKSWVISAPSAGSELPVTLGTYHIRGTFNAWAEGTLMAQVGTSNIYESCINFSTGDGAGGPRFKVDPNGAWGDAIPAGGDYLVNAGWVKVFFDASSKTISLQQNLSTNCSAASSSSYPSSSSSSSMAGYSPEGIYYLRGTHNAWAEDVLMTRIYTFERFEACAYFVGGDSKGGPRFRIDPNGGWGNDLVPLAGDFTISIEGWALIVYDVPTGVVSAQQKMPPHCVGGPYSSSAAVSSSIASSSIASSSIASSSSSSSSSSQASSSHVASSSIAPTTAYHLRGTFNGWTEGTLLNRIGTTNNYEKCVNFVYSDAGGTTRFKIDPNGAWGDEFPLNEYMVSAGWVKITLNSSTKVITTQENLPSNCGVNTYHLRGTHNAWAEGDLFESVDGIQPVWKICRDFGQASGSNNPLFKVDLNGGWGADAFPAADVSTSGWTSIVIEPGRIVSMTKNMAPNCAAN